jgi:hypothetical protein
MRTTRSPRRRRRPGNKEVAVRGRLGGVCGRGWVCGCGLLAGVALIVSMSGVAAAATTWEIQASPNVTVPDGQIQAVSCRSVSACTAVGYYLDRAGRYVPLAQAWNGSSWTKQAVPSPAGDQAPGLVGVSCVSASFCEAIGMPDESGSSASSSPGFAEAWNGSSWSVQSMPSPAGAASVLLKGVSCVSASFCEAVGSYVSSDTTLSLAEEWNGTAWTVQSTPNQAGVPTQLDGVSCVSATFCEAADFYGAVAEAWNGTSWTTQSVPYPSGMNSPGLISVSCPSATFCEAVGVYDDPDVSPSGMLLADVWNGTSWQEQSLPSSGANSQVLDAVSCPSARFCEAVGDQEAFVSGVDTFHALADVWRGGAWHLQHPPSAPGTAITDLTGVSCAAADDCEAGGYLPVRMEVWDGTSWAMQKAVNPAGAADNALDGVSCLTATFCEAVGTSSGPHPGLAEVWDGSAWKIQSSTALPPELAAVSCVTASFCEAVGGGSSTANAAAVWDGTSWQLQPTPSEGYVAVSCVSASFCAAIGGEEAATWNGTSWSAEPLPAVTDGSYTGVSCTSASACETVGSASTGGVFAAGWNGTAWTAQAAPAPSGASRTSLTKVSCATATACVAVGNSTAGAYSDAWNGSAWTVQALLALPSGAHATAPTDVVCTSATACTAVGYSTWLTSPQQTLVEAWDGTSWNVQPTPNTGAGNNELDGVSCVTAGSCVAVGSAPDPGGYSATLVEASG